MSDQYRIDSHKLIFHPKRVGQWLDSRGDWEKQKKIYPIYLEISPVGFCNHRCSFCAVDYVGYKQIKIDPEILKERLKEMAQLGVKSVMFAGEGEPTLYKQLPEIVELCTEIGIDTSLTTNFVPLTEKTAETYVKNCSWIKISMNAGEAENYAEIHGTDKKDFDKVIENIKLCTDIKKKKNYRCTIGAQILLVEENAKSLIQLAEITRELGLDYLVVKPYSQHLASNTTKHKNMDYSKLLYLADELEKFNTDSFKVIFRVNTMKKLIEDSERYEHCLSVPFFWGYVMADGRFSTCSAFLEDERFEIGNIHEKRFKEIWESTERLQNLKILENLDIAECRVNCRMDEINRYLWELTHPSDHVNFI